MRDMHSTTNPLPPFGTALVIAVCLVGVSASAAVSETETPLWTIRTAASPSRIEMPSLGPLVKEVAPAVLTITTQARAQTAKGPDPTDPGFELFRRFGLEFEMPRMPRMGGQGTGFLISPEGYALTNHHVVENAGSIKVRVGAERREYDAVVIGSDPKTDVALIKLQGARKGGFPVIPLGDSAGLEVGDFVVAIGNPFGLSQSVSMGILSARGRRDIAPSGRQGLYDFLQTDASINPGNSGGPLVNLNGEVVGINTAINAAGQGIGFAIPVDLVKQLLPDLRANGRVSRSWLGVSIRGLTPELAEGFGLDRPKGALVAQVVAGGPGAKAGLQPGDIILSFDGRPIDEATQLPLLAGLAGVGKNVPLELVREGRIRNVTVLLEELPSEGGPAPATETERAQAEASGKLGLTIDDLRPEVRRQLKLPKDLDGAYVVRVLPGTAAAEAGIMNGDVVLQVNGREVRSANAFVSEVRKVKTGKLLRLLVRRGDGTVFAAMVKP
jgi:serine protease Do